MCKKSFLRVVGTKNVNHRINAYIEFKLSISTEDNYFLNEYIHET